MRDESRNGPPYKNISLKAHFNERIEAALKIGETLMRRWNDSDEDDTFLYDAEADFKDDAAQTDVAKNTKNDLATDAPTDAATPKQAGNDPKVKDTINAGAIGSCTLKKCQRLVPEAFT
ncbi:MAG: hypothetical protein Q9221_006811 [Calogaya cf. arnoldii]